jgi:hypothetical protein
MTLFASRGVNSGFAGLSAPHLDLELRYQYLVTTDFSRSIVHALSASTGRSGDL